MTPPAPRPPHRPDHGPDVGRAPNAKLSESLKMQFKALKANEKRRRDEAAAEAADAAPAMVRRRRRHALPRRVRRERGKS